MVSTVRKRYLASYVTLAVLELQNKPEGVDYGNQIQEEIYGKEVQ